MLQPTWGRIQQHEESVYEKVISLLYQLHTKEYHTHQTEPTPERFLEELKGFVDQIEGDVAYVTLEAGNGDQLQGEYAAAELLALGIREHRYFTCRTIDTSSGVRVELSPVQDREVSKEQKRAIEDQIRQALGGENGPQDDY